MAKHLNYIIVLIGLIFFISCQNTPNSIYDAFRGGDCSSLTELNSVTPDRYKNNAEYWYFKGVCNLEMQNYVVAKQDFLKAQELDYLFKKYTYFGLAAADVNLENTSSGLNYLEKSLNEGLDYSFLFIHHFDKVTNSPRYIELLDDYRPSFDFWTSVLVFLAFQGIILGIFIFFKKSINQSRNRYLGLLLLCNCLILLYYILILTNLIYYLPYLSNSYHFLLYLLGPTLYLYYEVLFEVGKGKTRYWYHFIPSMVVFAIVILFKLKILSFTYYELAINAFVKSIHMALYAFLCYRMFGQNEWKLSPNFKQWFYLILHTYTFLVIMLFVQNIVFLILDDLIYAKVFFALSLSSLICMTLFIGYTQPQIFWGKTLREIVKNKVKYGSSGLSNVLSKEFKHKLLKKMKEEELYLDSNINHSKLAQIMNLSKHHLSQVINENFNMGFYDFINKFRLEKSIELLENENLNILEVAFNSGFNNKVSFYRAFKKRYAQTPLEYRNLNLSKSKG